MGCDDDSWVPGIRLGGGKESLNARGSQPRRWWCPNVREKNTRSGSIRKADLIPAWGGLIKASEMCHFCMTFGRLERWQEECSRQRGNRRKLLMGPMPRVAASLGYFNPEGIVGAQGELRGGTERPCREAAAAEQDLVYQAE